MTNYERQQKLFLMHQTSLCEFQRYLKFGMEDKIGGGNVEEAFWG